MTIIKGVDYSIGKHGIQPSGGQVDNRVDLHFEGGGSNKFYIVIVSQNRNGDYFTDAFYGRVGANAQSASKYIGRDQTSAGRIASQLVDEKMRKGYVKVSQSNQGTGTKSEYIYTHIPPHVLKDDVTGNGFVSAAIEDPEYILEKGFSGYPAFFSNITGKPKLYKCDPDPSDITNMYPDVTNIFSNLPYGYVIEGTLQANCFIASDVLYIGGVSYENVEWKDRRRMLTQLIKSLSHQSPYNWTPNIYDDMFAPVILSRYAFVNKREFFENAKNHHSEVLIKNVHGNHPKTETKGQDTSNTWYRWRRTS